MSVHTCRSEVGTLAPWDSDIFRRDCSSLAKIVESRGKGFYSPSSIISRCCYIDDEVLGGLVIGALKYSSNSSSGIKTREARWVTLWCCKQLVPWVSATGLLTWEMGWLSRKSTSAKGLVNTLATWGGDWGAGLAAIGSLGLGYRTWSWGSAEVEVDGGWSRGTSLGHLLRGRLSCSCSSSSDSWSQTWMEGKGENSTRLFSCFFSLSALNITDQEKT